MTIVLHVTPHLGGGVGKALSGLVEQTNISKSGIYHHIVCLEKNKKRQFVDRIHRYGCRVIECPEISDLQKLMESSDIVQLEWWNHPATFKYLCSMPTLSIRLLTWYHNSGLYTPIIPKQLILTSHIFLFTSQCSFENKEIMDIVPELGDRLGMVSSSGGFSGLPKPRDRTNEDISVGYFGSTNFSKFHPRYIDYLAEIKIPGFKIKIVGDLQNQNILDTQCNTIGKTGMVKFVGFVPDIVSELDSINVLAYILNPKHYGTTENALLEGMAMGIVPVVLDNPAERHIVCNNCTGLIVHSPEEFAKAVQWLSENPIERQRLGTQAAESVRKRFSAEKMEESLNVYYKRILSMKKREINFSKIFGKDPVEWFLSCLSNKNIFARNGNIHMDICLDDSVDIDYWLFEKNKGSIFHFNEYFPDNLELKSWAKNLELLKKDLNML